MAKKFWGSELAMDFSTYDSKALSAKMVQDRTIANECGIFCVYIYPMCHSPSVEGYVGDPSLENQIMSAVLGKDIDEKGLYKIGERIVNLHRAVMSREGYG